jgi:hypothetical protein
MYRLYNKSLKEVGLDPNDENRQTLFNNNFRRMRLRRKNRISFREMMINYRQQVRNEESCVRMEIDEVNEVRNSNVIGINPVQLNQENANPNQIGSNNLNNNYSIQNNLMSQNGNLEESQVRVVEANNRESNEEQPNQNGNLQIERQFNIFNQPRRENQNHFENHNQLSQPNLLGNYNQLYQPNQLGFPNQFGNFNQYGIPNQFSFPGQFGFPNQFGIPYFNMIPNQFPLQNYQNQQGNQNQQRNQNQILDQNNSQEEQNNENEKTKRGMDLNHSTFAFGNNTYYSTNNSGKHGRIQNYFNFQN